MITRQIIVTCDVCNKTIQVSSTDRAIVKFLLTKQQWASLDPPYVENNFLHDEGEHEHLCPACAPHHHPFYAPQVENYSTAKKEG